MGLGILFCQRRQKPESAKDLTIAVAKWEKNLQRAKCPQDYLPFLLSNLEFVEKARILYKVANHKGLPDNLFQNHGVENVAGQLQRAGQSDLSRLLWYFLYHQKEHDDRFLEWCFSMIILDLCSRWSVQSEIRGRNMLLSKGKELQLVILPEKRAEIVSAISDMEMILTQLADSYPQLCRLLRELQEHTPSGPLHRAFSAWRSNPDWYLCDWLRRECASRGGCCGRSCGCCDKPRDTERVALSRGHCTSACSCCILTHGEPGHDDFDWEVEQLIHGQGDMYTRRLCRAYIWGADVLNEIEDEEESKSETLERSEKAGNVRPKWKPW